MKNKHTKIADAPAALLLAACKRFDCYWNSGKQWPSGTLESIAKDIEAAIAAVESEEVEE